MNRKSRMLGSKSNWLDRLEAKFGKYAIPDLMKYMAVIYALGFIINAVNSGFYFSALSLDFSKIFKGEVWRLVTFILFPPTTFSDASDILWIIIEIYLYIMIGRSLENAWGAFRFNLYYFSGVLFSVLGSLIAYLIFGPIGYAFQFALGGTFKGVHQAMFLAFALIFPNIELLLFFVIPIKVKWLGFLYAAIVGYDVVKNTIMGFVALGRGSGEQSVYFMVVLTTLLSLANLIIFYISSKNVKKYSPKQAKRRAAYKKKINVAASKTRHQCEICKRTEEGNPELEFRFCSKCDGNHEYCMEHLFTHEHVKRFTINLNKDED